MIGTRKRKPGKDQKPKVVILIPAFNEERFIGSVVLKVRKTFRDVVVIDDGSTDSTGEIAKAAGALVIKHKKNLGKSQALNTLFQKCRTMKPDAVVTLDADAQHLPDEISMILTPILNGEADIVIGSRYLRKNNRVPLPRILGHVLTTSLTNLSSGVRASDSQSGFRAFSAKALNTLNFRSPGFSVESEMQFLIQENHLKLLEVPITALYKDKPKRSLLKHGLLVINGILNLVGQHRPLLFFGVSGLVALLVGIAWGLWVVEIYRQFQNLAIGYALISVSLIIIGSLSLFTGIILHAIRGQISEIKEIRLLR